MALKTRVFLMSLFFVTTAQADSLWLVTPEEVSKDAIWATRNFEPPKPKTRAFSTSSNPEIVVTSPASLSEPLKAPFPIRVAFKAKDGAAIKPDTFRAYYGFLKVDITERLTGKAKIAPEGIVVESANIPVGSHKLVLRVSDDQSRQGETEIRFSVE